MASPVVLVTQRLMLKPHTVADFADVAALWSDATVTAFVGGPTNEEDSWARLLRYAGSWALLGFGSWAVREAAGGEYVGGIGFLDARRTGVAGFDGDPEIGWSLNARHQGKGYATEAVRAALGWGGGRFKRTVAMIHPDNAASLAVARRCGFRQFGDGSYKDAPTTLWDYRFR